MNMQRRLAMLLASAAIIAAACSSGGATTAPSADASAPASTPPESTAPESQAPAGLAGEVSLWHSYSSGAGTELDALNQVLDAVKTANPELTVEVLEVPVADI
jgi:ABC-type glycerol-3-phosphate transport system substrate-binding protein